MVMAGPRVYARMAEDRLFPAWLGVGGALPPRAVLFEGGAAIAVVWNAELVEVLGYVGFLLGLSAAATVALSLRARAPVLTASGSTESRDPASPASVSCAHTAPVARLRPKHDLLWAISVLTESGAPFLRALRAGNEPEKGERSCRSLLKARSGASDLELRPILR